MRGHGVTGAHEDVVIRREGAVEILRRQLAAPRARDLAREPLVIYASPLVDVAANMELVRETIECCRLILHETRWTIRLLSKSNLLPKIAEALEHERGYFGADGPDWTGKERLIFGVSTGTLDDRVAAAFESGCALVSKRLASLHWLQDHGFRTFGMVCPSLPFPRDVTGRPLGYLYFAWSMAMAIRASRCEHVWAEVINVRGESFRRTEAQLRAHGLNDYAADLHHVATDPEAWEGYSRETFVAHAQVYATELGGVPGPPAASPSGPKLRFLQYVKASTREWWEGRRARGAVVLGVKPREA